MTMMLFRFIFKTIKIVILFLVYTLAHCYFSFVRFFKNVSKRKYTREELIVILSLALFFAGIARAISKLI